MPNRFARRIRDGAIRTPGDLKTEFKALAKAYHPDLAGQAAGEEFIRVRSEYESALRNFEVHRFRTRPKSVRRGDAGGADTPSAGAAPGVFAALAVLRKRGFPKKPRHEKERYRYEYARYRFETALGELGEGFKTPLEDIEGSLIELRFADPETLASVLSYLDALTDYSLRGLPAMRTFLAQQSSSLQSDPRIPEPVKRFLAGLSRVLALWDALPNP